MEPTTRSLNLPQRARLLPAGSGRINSLFVLSVLDLHWLATMGFSGPLASPALHHHGTASRFRIKLRRAPSSPASAARLLAHSPWFPQQPRRLFFPTANTERNVAESGRSRSVWWWTRPGLRCAVDRASSRLTPSGCVRRGNGISPVRREPRWWMASRACRKSAAAGVGRNSTRDSPIESWRSDTSTCSSDCLPTERPHSSTSTKFRKSISRSTPSGLAKDWLAAV